MQSVLPPPIIVKPTTTTTTRQRLLVVLFLGLSFLAQAATAQVLSPDSSVPEAGGATATGTSSTPTNINNHNNVVTTQNTVKFLVCGDSITQGAEGDFTWRYRLWEWFRANAQPSMTSTSTSSSSPSSSVTPTLQYVGPYNGTLPASAALAIDLADPQTYGRYHEAVDPSFSPGGGSAHFAVYGRPAWMDVDLIRDQVVRHEPDFVVLHLGFNDFGWWGQTAAELLESVHKLVENARLGSGGGKGRGITFLVADVSHRLLVQGREDIPPTTDAYNAMLREKALGWSTAESPVLVVNVSEDYDCHVEACPAGVDGLHPNALGDYQIARAYTKVLHDKYQFGAEPLAVPDPESIPSFGQVIIGGGGAVAVAGSSSSSSSSSASVGGIATDAFMYPPVGIFVVVSVLCLVAVVVLRPRLAKALRHGGGGGGGLLGGWYGGKYQLLPTNTARETS